MPPLLALQGIPPAKITKKPSGISSPPHTPSTNRPEGLLGEDAHCFDIDASDDALIGYVMTRLDEAFAKAAAEKD